MTQAEIQMKFEKIEAALKAQQTVILHLTRCIKDLSEVLKGGEQ